MKKQFFKRFLLLLILTFISSILISISACNDLSTKDVISNDNTAYESRKYLHGQVNQFGNNGAFFTMDYENARFIIITREVEVIWLQAQIIPMDILS